MNVLIIGDSCIDEFVYGYVNRISPEAPVPILEPFETKQMAGMAGNVYNNLQNLELNCTFITNKTKSIKRRFVEYESNQMILRVDTIVNVESFNFSNYEFTQLDKYDVIVISDYDKGFLTSKDIKNLSLVGPVTFLDTKKKKLNSDFDNIKFLKINNVEYLENKTYLDAFPNNLIVTLGSKGARYNGKIYDVKKPSAIFDLTGAGDVFLSGLVFKYMKTKSVEKSIIFANECASKSVQKRGTGLINKNIANG
jgi:D-beta-D-heptose 7-phosphate kinase/D-beta-D-heptose 1-phosphate adenosyltransferase